MLSRPHLTRPLIVAFSMAAGLILLTIGLSLAQSQTNADLVRVTTRVGAGSRFVFDPIMSRNGGKIAFYSDSDFLNEGIPDNQQEVWLADTGTLSITRITEASDTNRDSAVWGISDDGTRLAIESDSDFLGQGIPDGLFEIWIYDTDVMTFTRITSATASNRDSYVPVLSPDGSKVAFSSDSDFLGNGVLAGQYEMWLVDLNSHAITQVTEASDSGRESWNPNFDGDASHLVFYSDSDFLSEGIPDNQQEVWLYNIATEDLTRISHGSAVGRNSYDPVLSHDGTKVAFWSDSDILTQGISDEQYEIWLYDLVSLSYTRVTSASHPGRVSRDPTFGGNDRLLTFSSDSDILGEGIPQGQREIWIYDLETGEFRRVTEASHDNRTSTQPSMNAAGTKIAFLSDSDFFNQGIGHFQGEVWLATVGYQVYLPVVIRN